MNIKVLGTVSPYCKDATNCPGYLVRKDNKKVLLDCGNGITRNMKFPDDLEDLVVVISHLHKDHYGDLLALGYASYVYKNLGYLKKPIKVYIPDSDDKPPRVTGEWQTPISYFPKDVDNYFLIHFGDEHFLEFIPYNDKSKINVGDLDISFSLNPHPIKSFSIKVCDNESAIVYSGDTGYKNNSLVEFSKGADLLICESTFIRGQNKSNDGHLYAFEAGMIAKDAGVQRLVLSHFFPECEKDDYVKEASQFFNNTEAAVENKVLKIGGLK